MQWPTGDITQGSGAEEAATSAAYGGSGDPPTGVNPQRRAAVRAGILYGLGAAQPALAIGTGRRGKDPTSSTDPNFKSLAQQMAELNVFTSMNGVWKVREYDREGQIVATGTLTFRGNPGGSKGAVEYDGDGQQEEETGRGRWSMRPDGFAKAPLGSEGGVIQNKARWNLRKSLSGVFVYAGVVKVDGFTKGRPDAVITGEVVQLIKGGDPNGARGGYERKVGTFSANLRRLLTEEEYDAAAEGPQPVLVSVATV